MIRRIIRIFAWSLAVVVVLVAGLLAYLRSADLSIYQEQIEGFVAGQIGHELRVGGRFELQFGRTTVLVAEDLVLVNPDWPGDGELLSVGHLTFAFNTWSLLSRPFLVEELRAIDVAGQLLHDASGAVNWVSHRVEPARPEPDSGPLDLTRIAFRKVDIERVEFRVEDPTRPRPLHTTIELLTVSPDKNGILDLDLRGDINELPLWADGKVGPWRNFVSGKDIFADLNVAYGQAKLSLEGTIADVVNLEGIELTAALSGPTIERALERLGVPQFATGAFTVSANVQQQDVGHLVRLDGSLGQIALFASGNTDSILNPRSVNYDFNITGPNAGAVAGLAGLQSVPEAPFQISGEYTREMSVIGLDNALLRVGRNVVEIDGNLELDSLDVDMAVTAEGPDFSTIGSIAGTSGLPAEPFALTGRIRKDGATWEAANVDARVGANRLTINGQVDSSSDSASQITLEATGPDISVVQDFTGLQGIPDQPFDVDVVLRSHPQGIEVAQGTGVFGGNRVELQGVIAMRPGLQGTFAAVRASGPEFHNVALLSDVPYLPPGPFVFAGNVAVEGDALRLDDFMAEVGEFRAAATGSIDIRGDETGGFGLDVMLQGSDLAALPEIEGLDQFAGDPFVLSGRISREGELLTATNLEVSVGNLDATVNGSVVGAAQHVRLSVQANAEDSIMVRKIARLEYLPEGPVAVDSSIEMSNDEVRFSETVLSIGDYRVAANGSLNLQPLSNDSDLVFSVSGPSLRDAGLIAGIEAMPERDFSVSGKFVGTSVGFDMQDFIARVGDNDVKGEFDVSLDGKPSVVGSLASTRLDLSNPSPGTATNDEDEAEDSGDDNDDGRLFPDDPLATSWLQAANVDIQLQIDDFIANTLHVTDVDIGLRLQDGALSVDPIFLRESDGSIEASFTLTPEDDQYSLQTWMDVKNVHLGALAPGIDDAASLPPTSGTMRFAGTGNSVRTIMASSNGQFSVRQGKGKVLEVFGSALFKDVLLQVLRSLNPLSESRDYQLLECGIYEISIKDGLANIDTFVVQTDTMTTVARGEINLANERLEVAFRAKPREGLGISLGTVANQLLEVQGTLKSPRIGVDAGRAATTTGAAVATGGLSLLARGLWDRLSAEGDLCNKPPKKK